MVVTLCPSQQRQYVSGQHRFGIEHRLRRPQRGGVQRGIGAEFEQKTDDVTPAERYPHPQARLQGGQVAARRWQVIENPIQRRRDGDPQNGAGHGADPSGAEQAGAQPFEHELNGQRRQDHAQQAVDHVGAGFTEQFHQQRGQQQG